MIVVNDYKMGLRDKKLTHIKKKLVSVKISLQFIRIQK